MATYGFKISINPSFKDIAQSVRRANQKLPEEKRQMLRTEGQRFVDLAGQEARGGPGGAIARGIFYRTFDQGADTAQLRVYPGQLGTWHLYGTGIYGPAGRLITHHTPGKMLQFDYKGEIMYRPYVRGVRPDPFFSRAYRRWLPGARSAMRTVAENWVRELTTARTQVKGVGV